MTHITRSAQRRKFGGKFNEKGEFTHVEKPAPHRYRCGCHPEGFVFGQVVKHFSFCPFHPKNVERYERRSRIAYIALSLAIGVIGSALAISFLMHV